MPCVHPKGRGLNQNNTMGSDPLKKERYMRTPQLRLAILLVMGVLMLGGCNGSKLFHSTDDKTITSNIQAKLFNDSVLKTQDIHVDARDGVVTLSGTVGTDLEKAAVERIAQEQDGVRNVVDMLSVTAQSAATTSEPSPAAETAAAPPPAGPGHHTGTNRAEATSARAPQAHE